MTTTQAETQTTAAAAGSDERIGDFLVRIGAMTPEHQSDVLRRQAEEPGRLFGEIAVELAYIDDDAVDAYLAQAR
ncbi:MAG: hypothetical protein EA382_08085 [Spirochaetaceae bacterium]|nr:MAG: hypothetical protein EA382_08085 [Spirochaetaceae bacterium]